MDGCSRQNPAYRSATGEAPGDRSLFCFRSTRNLRTNRPVRGCQRAARRTSVGTVTPRQLASRRRVCEHVFPLMVVCVLLPRFELAVAAGGREALAAGPLALAPEIGREPLIGETSAAAEAYGVLAGLRLGEALARCPTLRLVTPDPAGVADAWERVVDRAGGDRRRGGVRKARHRLVRGARAAPPARRERRGRDRHTRRAQALRARPGGRARSAARAAPSRFAALAAAHRARARRPEIAPEAGAWPPTSRRCPSRSCAPGPRSPRCRRRWSASASPRSAISRSCRARARRPLRGARAARARPRPRQGHAAAPARALRAPAGDARAARVGLRPAARARARPADRPRARPPGAARAHASAPSCSRRRSSAAAPGARS